jgi:hypothetical protein
MTDTIIGEGILSWGSTERVSDRYGAIILMADGDSETEPTGYASFDSDLDGRRGTLIARVQETRQSTHIGDLFRGLRPTTPEVGEEITLGNGVVFTELTSWGNDSIGVLPDDGRDTDWMDPKALYRAHEQTVQLILRTEG